MFNQNQAPGVGGSPERKLSPKQLAVLINQVKDPEEQRKILSGLTPEEIESLATVPLSPNEGGPAPSPKKTPEDIAEIRELNS